MKLTVLILASLVTFVGSAHAALIAKDTAIAEARMALKSGKYTETGLDMISRNSDTSLDFWAVDEGVLIISYSTKTGLIQSISYRLMDERPKSTRKAFDFTTVSFNTTDGTLILSTKKPK